MIKEVPSREYYEVTWRNNADELVKREFLKLIPAIEYRMSVKHSKDIKIVQVGGAGKWTPVTIRKIVEYRIVEE